MSEENLRSELESVRKQGDQIMHALDTLRDGQWNLRDVRAGATILGAAGAFIMGLLNAGLLAYSMFSGQALPAPGEDAEGTSGTSGGSDSSSSGDKTDIPQD